MHNGNNTLDDMITAFIQCKIEFKDLKEYMLNNEFDMSDIDVNGIFVSRAIYKAKKKGVIQ